MGKRVCGRGRDCMFFCTARASPAPSTPRREVGSVGTETCLDKTRQRTTLRRTSRFRGLSSNEISGVCVDGDLTILD